MIKTTIKTKAGKRLLEHERYNSRSFALITEADIVAIEEEMEQLCAKKVHEEARRARKPK